MFVGMFDRWIVSTWIMASCSFDCPEGLGAAFCRPDWRGRERFSASTVHLPTVEKRPNLQIASIHLGPAIVLGLLKKA